MARYALPEPPEGQQLVEAIQASLQLLDVAPLGVTAPLLAATCRAALGPCDFAEHLAGATGQGKSELAALFQQFYGAGLDARHLPASWSSTANALEGIAFTAKDALLVVDDFAPGGSQTDVQRLHRDADRLLRAQGNHSGRARMRADGSLRPVKPPRGLILSTGEDVPKGQSIRARTLVLELERGAVDWARLTLCQRDAAAGLYAAALSGFVRWLAPTYARTLAELPARIAERRAALLTEAPHRRTPEIAANLELGLLAFLSFAEAKGALTRSEAVSRWQSCRAAILGAAEDQAQHQETGDPAGQFLELLRGALVSGAAHLAAVDGNAPPLPLAWGWRAVEITSAGYSHADWRPLGARIGWVDDADVYLEPSSAYAAAQKLAREQGEAVAVTPRTLWRRMEERGLLVSRDRDRQKMTTRRTLGGKRYDVLHLTTESLVAGEPAQQAQQAQTNRTADADQEGTGAVQGTRGPVQWAGHSNGAPQPAQTTGPAAGPYQEEWNGSGPVGPVGPVVETLETRNQNLRDAWDDGLPF